MFEAIRAIQATTDSPYHRPQPVETKSNRPAFSLDLAYQVSDMAVPDSEPMGYSSEAIHALHDALMLQSYPVDAKNCRSSAVARINARVFMQPIFPCWPSLMG